MINFSVCPHYTDESIRKWEDIIKKMESKLSEKINFIKIKDLKEEAILIEKNELDLYYANPSASIKLFDKGYHPIAKIKNDKNIYSVLGYNNVEDVLLTKSVIKIGVLEHSSYLILKFIEKHKIDTNRVILIRKSSLEEIVDLFMNKDIDFAIIYWEFIDNVSYIKAFKLEDLEYYLSHIFMAKPEKKDKILNALTTISDFDIEPVDICYLKDIKCNLELFEEELINIKYKQLSDFLMKAKQIGILIFKDKCLYANNYALNKLGYDQDRMQNLSLLDITHNSQLPLVNKITENRLEGIFEDHYIKILKLVKKDGSTLIVETFCDVINYENSLVNILLFVDKTDEIKFQKIISLQREVNRTTVNATDIKEVFDTITKSAVKDMSTKYALVFEVKEDDTLSLVVQYGVSEKYHDYATRIIESIKHPKRLTHLAIKTNKILINPNTHSYDLVDSYKDELIEKEFLSSCSIPIFFNKKVKYVLNMYSDEIRFFNEDVKGALEELKMDIEFSLSKIERIKNSKILMEVVQNSQEWILIVEENGIIRLTNNTVLGFLKAENELIIGKHINKVFNLSIYWEEILSSLKDTSNLRKTLIISDDQGNLIHIDAFISKIYVSNLTSNENNLNFYLITGRDITKETELYTEIEKIKYVDEVTGYLNFLGFGSVLNNTLLDIAQDNIEQMKYKAIVLILDFSNQTNLAKCNNEDALIKTIIDVIEKSKQNIEKEVIVGRISSFQFTMFIKINVDETAPENEVNKIISIIQDQIEEYSLVHNISAYITEDYENFFDVFKKLNITLSLAKNNGENTVEIYSDKIRDLEDRYIKIETLLEKAVKENLFIFYYQPYIDLKTREIKGAEALARIQDGDILHFPGIFIDYLENSRFLRTFENIILDTVKEDIEDFKNIKQIPISINISAKSFREDYFLEKLLYFCKNTDAYIEITERLILDNPQRVIDFINRLKAETNSKIEIDDFGTGYSSLSYLKQINADILKIDISFVRSMVNDPRDAILVKNIITIAKDLGMKTIAEGVETEEQESMLRNKWCDYAQGFLYSKPLPKQEFIKLLEKGYL